MSEQGGHWVTDGSNTGTFTNASARCYSFMATRDSAVRAALRYELPAAVFFCATTRIE
jgi:hypothetical protein